MQLSAMQHKFSAMKGKAIPQTACSPFFDDLKKKKKIPHVRIASATESSFHVRELETTIECIHDVSQALNIYHAIFHE